MSKIRFQIKSTLDDIKKTLPTLFGSSSLSQQHQQKTWELAIPSQDYWPGVNFNTQPLLDSTAGSNISWQGFWAAVSGEDIDPPATPACGPNCIVHTEAFHDSLILLHKRNELPTQFVQRWQPRRTDEVLMWLVQQQSSLASSSLSAPVPDQAHLPIPPTRQNAELLRVYVNLISRYKSSLGGNPDINTNPYMKHYVPFCLHSPLLAQIAIYTSACFLNDTAPNIVDNTTAMTRKGAAIHMLKTHLRTTGSTTDEAIAGVTQLILNEWHWGDRKELEAHFGGLREMVRSRGGLSNLGLGGLLAKLVIVTDITIALFFEIEPYLQGGPEFEFHETVPRTPFRVTLSTPLVSPFVPFDTRVEHLNPHEAAARILDDMRFLIGLVLALAEDDPPQKDLQKIRTTSRWIYDRISGLPAHAPLITQHSKSEALLSPTSATSTARHCMSPISNPRRRSSGQQSPQDLYSPGPGSWPQGGNSTSSSNAHDRDMFSNGTDYFAHDLPHPTSSPSHPAPDENKNSNSDTATADIIYQAVRQSALIYSRAIMLRRPLRDAAVCSEEDFLRLWTTVWRVPLRGWKAVLGVFVWMVLCITPASRDTPHERFVKSMLEIGMVQMALENWHVAERGMAGALRLTRWLARRGEEKQMAAAEGSGYKPYGSTACDAG
ncbi:hypothetical protein VM1G_09938 [Cytospora mali]|uniref:Uncharacterized protein n=1 Tax=Cytospora mali TaxID=578113 RepID=A0A194WD57_CYTMA|nr:hypothetical protein VM1G_09938 [Valsa mali]